MESFITWKSLDIQSIIKSIKLGLLDLTNKNTEDPVKFQFQKMVNNFLVKYVPNIVFNVLCFIC